MIAGRHVAWMVAVLLLVPVVAGCDDDTERIISDLESANPMLRLEAAKLARREPSPQVAAALAPRLEDESRDIRLTAAESLAYIGTAEQVPALIDALDDPSPEVRLAAVNALGQIQDERAVEPLMAMLSTEEEPYSVIWALGNIGSPDSLDKLAPMLDHENRYVRYQTRRALLQIH